MTGLQARVLMCAQDYFARVGYAATTHDISERLGYGRRAHGSVVGALYNLTRRGYISRNPEGNQRGFTPTILGYATVNGRELPIFPVSL